MGDDEVVQERRVLLPDLVLLRVYPDSNWSVRQPCPDCLPCQTDLVDALVELRVHEESVSRGEAGTLHGRGLSAHRRRLVCLGRHGRCGCEVGRVE